MRTHLTSATTGENIVPGIAGTPFSSWKAPMPLDAWQRVEDLPLRKEILQEINNILGAKCSNHRIIPRAARILEGKLYRSAVSLEDYRNATTLASRVSRMMNETKRKFRKRVAERRQARDAIEGMATLSIANTRILRKTKPVARWSRLERNMERIKPQKDASVPCLDGIGTAATHQMAFGDLNRQQQTPPGVDMGNLRCQDESDAQIYSVIGPAESGLHEGVKSV